MKTSAISASDIKPTAYNDVHMEALGLPNASNIGLEPATKESAPNTDEHDATRGTEENMPKTKKKVCTLVYSETEIPFIDLTSTKVDGEGMQASSENLNTADEFPVFNGDDSDAESIFRYTTSMA